FTVINQGNSAASGKWNDTVYLSLDNQISGDDLVIGTIENGAALAKGESYKTIAPSLTIPRRYRGAVFILVHTDSGNAIDETPNDNNNVFAKAITVIPLVPSDLVTSEVVAPTQAFDTATIQVKFKVTNLGAGITDVDGWTDTVWPARHRKPPAVTT